LCPFFFSKVEVFFSVLIIFCICRVWIKILMLVVSSCIDVSDEGVFFLQVVDNTAFDVSSSMDLSDDQTSGALRDDHEPVCTCPFFYFYLESDMILLQFFKEIISEVFV